MYLEMEKIFYILMFVVLIVFSLFTIKRCNDCQNVGGTYTRNGCFKQEVKDY